VCPHTLSPERKGRPARVTARYLFLGTGAISISEGGDQLDLLASPREQASDEKRRCKAITGTSSFTWIKGIRGDTFAGLYSKKLSIAFSLHRVNEYFLERTDWILKVQCKIVSTRSIKSSSITGTIRIRRFHQSGERGRERERERESYAVRGQIVFDVSCHSHISLPDMSVFNQQSFSSRQTDRRTYGRTDARYAHHHPSFPEANRKVWSSGSRLAGASSLILLFLDRFPPPSSLSLSLSLSLSHSRSLASSRSLLFVLCFSLPQKTPMRPSLPDVPTGIPGI